MAEENRLTLTELITAINKLTDDQKSKVRDALGISTNASDIKGSSIGATNEEIEATIKLLKYREDLARHYSDEASARKVASQQYQEILKLEEQGFTNLQKAIDIAVEKGLATREEVIAIQQGSEEEQKRFRRRMAAHQAGMQISEEELNRLEELHEEQSRLGPLHEEAQRAGERHFGSLAGMMGKHFGKNAFENSFFGRISEIGRLAQSPDGMQGLAESFVSIFNAANIAAAIFSAFLANIKAFATEVDKAASDLAKFTGQGIRATQMIAGVADANRINGITADAAGKAIQGLTTSFKGFTTLGGSTQKVMVESAAQLEAIGVNAETSGKIMTFFANNVGMTGREAAKLTKNLAMMGKQLGMNASVITKEFEAALGTLAVYGDRAPKIFMGLAASAQAAQVEVGELLSLAEKFDTFESAATTIGKLNALMGTQMNASSMLMMTEDKRIETLIQTVQAQGIAFKDMDRFTQKSLMMAAGIKDVNTAQRIFGMNVGQYQKFAQEQDIAESRQAELNEAMRKAIPVMTKIKLLFAEMVLNLSPLVDTVSDGITAFHEFAKENELVGDIVFKVIPGFAGLFLAIKTLNFVTFGGIAKLAGYAKGLLTTGAAAAKAGATTGGAVKGMTTSVTSSLVALGKAGPAAAKGIAIFAVGALVVTGAAIGLAYAMNLILSGFAELAKAGPNVLTDFATVLYAVSTAAMSLALFGTLAAAQLVPLSIAIVGLGIALRTLPTEELKAFSALAKGLGDIDDVAVKASFQAASKFVNELDSKSANVKPMLANIALMTTAASAAPGLVAAATAITAAADKIAGAAGEKRKIDISLSGEDMTDFFRGETLKTLVGTGQ
jgi:hypothetical protein